MIVTYEHQNMFIVQAIGWPLKLNLNEEIKYWHFSECCEFQSSDIINIGHGLVSVHSCNENVNTETVSLG